MFLCVSFFVLLQFFLQTKNCKQFWINGIFFSQKKDPPLEGKQLVRPEHCVSMEDRNRDLGTHISGADPNTMPHCPANYSTMLTILYIRHINIVESTSFIHLCLVIFFFAYLQKIHYFDEAQI